MLKFALGVLAGTAATVAYGAVRVIREEESNELVETPAEIIGKHTLILRRKLLERMLAGPRAGDPAIAAKALHEYYLSETARIDAIYYGQPS